MIIEDARIVGIQCDLAYLDEVTEKLGFVRWQWEYTRATYDCKMEADADRDAHYLRISTRAVKGKLESPDAILQIEAAYMGKATYPHGIVYDIPIPEALLETAREKLAELYQKLKKDQLVEEAMRSEVPRIEPHATLTEALEKMKTGNAGVLAVVRDGALVGIVTERDVALGAFDRERSQAARVEEVMSSSVPSVDAERFVAEAVRTMARENLSSIPVVKKGALVGMLKLDDLAAKGYFD